jgi:hypothetical protein
VSFPSPLLLSSFLTSDVRWPKISFRICNCVWYSLGCIRGRRCPSLPCIQRGYTTTASATYVVSSDFVPLTDYFHSHCLFSTSVICYHAAFVHSTRHYPVTTLRTLAPYLPRNLYYNRCLPLPFGPLTLFIVYSRCNTMHSTETTNSQT